ncbi:hypothetical protein FA95DRAFT_1614059 [Auriscalpium vulgare]|uniref:Uncharacterized protein n=1 Tax=Auriscalpium vulgare TaxID=40419 RepID=A0ACB8R0T9_9AGAM|nr:hypothetical protein FA95DRAFT_1614059 [Auriscalpium vulgare]
MSPDFPAHYVPPTPYVIPSDSLLEPLQLDATSWADDTFAEATVNNIPTITSVVEPAALPLSASRSATPMDATD